jgi:hypothetical protein
MAEEITRPRNVKTLRSIERIEINTSAQLSPLDNRLSIILSDNDHNADGSWNRQVQYGVEQIHERFGDIKDVVIDANNSNLTPEEQAFVTGFKGKLTIGALAVLIKAGCYSVRDDSRQRQEEAAATREAERQAALEQQQAVLEATTEAQQQAAALTEAQREEAASAKRPRSRTETDEDDDTPKRKRTKLKTTATKRKGG